MRILHVITSLYTGGAERLMVDLLPLLRDDGNNQVELLLVNGVETPFKKRLIENGVTVQALSMTNDVYHPRNLVRMRRFLKLHAYDVIHTHNTACQLHVAMAKFMGATDAHLVTTEHNATNRRRSKKWLKFFDRWMYNQYDRIICIADKTRNNLERHIGHQSKICTIYNGIDVSRFIKPVKDITAKIRFDIVMVSAFREQKDHVTLLKAMRHLPDNYLLKLVGSGPKEQVSYVKEKCKDYGLDDRVEFMGVRQDVPEIMEQSDVVVLSSHWEGLSLSSIEGMASGRPFVASDVDGLREMVGGAGVLFDHGDERDLAQKIQHLCEHPNEYRDVAQRCQEKARQYDISIMADKYLRLYKTLVE